MEKKGEIIHRAKRGKKKQFVPYVGMLKNTTRLVPDIRIHPLKIINLKNSRRRIELKNSRLGLFIFSRATIYSQKESRAP
jgi:hypothetical protein